MTRMTSCGVAVEDALHQEHERKCTACLRIERDEALLKLDFEKIENVKLKGDVRFANLQVKLLQAVAEAARDALGCCDYGCEKFEGCDHKNCCSNDTKVIETLRLAGYAEKRLPEVPTIEDLLGECRECNRLVRDCGRHGP